MTCGSASHAACWSPPDQSNEVGALTARQRAFADSMSLNAIATPAAREPGPLVTR